MSDPICRWRNPYLPTVIELINLLPREEQPQHAAREIIIATSPDFFRTPYQLACQLGLYHETNNRYFPKFNYVPTEDEVSRYLENWIIHYCVPNPYTRGFNNLQPFSIHAELCGRLHQVQSPLDWNRTTNDIFHESIGNNDILKNSLNSYSPVISIDHNVIRLKPTKTYEDLQRYVNVDINIDRSNKEYFFDLFILPTPVNETQANENNLLSTSISREEIEEINQIQNNITLTQTEKNQIVAARIGQGLFRRNLIYECGICPITGIDDSRLLIASHIKPWRSSTNPERLSVKNGFLFTPTFDKLFDRGFISFTSDKKIIVSPLLSENTRIRLDINNGKTYGQLPSEGRETYLDYHRGNIFKG